MASTSEFSGNVVGDNATIVQGGFHANFTAGSSDTDHVFLNKISKTDPFYDKKRILELKGPFLHESFSWILDHDGFRKWRCSKDSGVLWIKGDPGKGKTMLLCGIIDDLEQDPGINSNRGYFFCQATDSRINTAASVISGLIVSLIKRQPTLLSRIRQKFEDKLNQLDGPNEWVVLCDMFRAVTEDSNLTYPVCIVDALDECEHDCNLLLKFIAKTSSHVKWLLSSRNVRDIERELRHIDPNRVLGLELKGNAQNISQSVEKYINHFTQNIEALEDDEQLQIKTTDILKAKANGTFLWVALVIQQLRDTDRRNVEDVLEEVPEGLDNLYDMIILRANKKLRQKDRDGCRILLSIVTTAERPLHLEELYVFVSSQWENYKAAYDVRDMNDIVKACGSLLSVRDDTVYFIHQSVKDYMVNHAAEHIFPSGIEYQHYKMLQSSLSAMSSILKYNMYELRDPQRHMDDITPPYPDPLVPIAYSCVFWVEHLIRAYNSGGFGGEDCFKDDGLLQKFIKTKYLCWLEALALLRSLTPQGGSALQSLNKLAGSYCKSRVNKHQATNSQEEEETNYLLKFINDAYQFFHYCQEFVKKWPLQLYYSAIIFEDKHNSIYMTYWQPVRAHFGEFITFPKKPQRHRFLQRKIDIERGYSGTRLLYSPDSSTLCVPTGGISLYRANTMKCAIQLSVDQKHHHYVSFLPDSRYLISVSSIGIVQTWAVDSGIQVQQVSLNLEGSKRHADYPSKVFREEVISLSPHGDLAAAIFLSPDEYGYLNNRLSLMRIWRTKTGACVREIDLMHIPGYDELYTIASNSALIALTNKHDARIYSVRTGEMVKHISTATCIEYIAHSQFSQDSALLALAHEYSGIYLWCTTRWTMIRHIKLDVIRHFDLSHDASMFVAVSRKALVFGSTRTGKQLFKIETEDNSANVLFSPDWSTSSLLASANSNAVQIWRIDTRYFSAEMMSAAYVDSSIAISPGSKYVAAISLEGYIHIFSAKSGECIQVLKVSSDRARRRPVFSPNMEYVACADGDRGDVRIWRLTTGESLHLLENHSGSCRTQEMTFSDDSKYLFIGYDNKEVRIWCAESGKCLFKSDDSDGDGDDDDDYTYEDFEVWALAISPKSTYIARASRRIWVSDETWEVCTWDWRACHDISSFGPKRPKRAMFAIQSLAFSSDATILAAICQVGETIDQIPVYETQIWEVATGTCIACVAIGESFSIPFFDAITNKILTDRAAFSKRSSWEHWENCSRWAYSLLQPISDWSWICFGGEKLFLIPSEFSTRYSFDHVAVSSSLLAYTTPAGGIMIIQRPSQHELQRLGIIALDSDNIGDSSLRADNSNSEVVSYLAMSKSDSDEPKNKKLKLSYILE